MHTFVLYTASMERIYIDVQVAEFKKNMKHFRIFTRRIGHFKPLVKMTYPVKT